MRKILPKKSRSLPQPRTSPVRMMDTHVYTRKHQTALKHRVRKLGLPLSTEWTRKLEPFQERASTGHKGMRQSQTKVGEDYMPMLDLRGGKMVSETSQLRSVMNSSNPKGCVLKYNLFVQVQPFELERDTSAAMFESSILSSPAFFYLYCPPYPPLSPAYAFTTSRLYDYRNVEKKPAGVSRSNITHCPFLFPFFQC